MFDRFVNASLKHIETMEENSSTKTSYILLFRTQKNAETLMSTPTVLHLRNKLFLPMYPYKDIL